MKNMILVGLLPTQRISARIERRFRFQAFGAFNYEGKPRAGFAVTLCATS